MYASIQKWGNSHAIRLPRSILTAAQVKENESVEIIVEHGDIIIRKTKPHKTMEERFAGFSEDFAFIEMDSGKPQGREVF